MVHIYCSHSSYSHVRRTLNSSSAIYDYVGLRFVYGYGVYIKLEQVCFIQSFRSGPPELASGQRLYLMETLKRSARYYQALYSGDQSNLGSFKDRFQTGSAVKAALTFVSDLNFIPPCPPALGPLPQEPKDQMDEMADDQGVPCRAWC